MTETHGTEGSLFVIQEHWARNHHFDFRLEKDGVLKSWAVPKAIPERVGEKRLAVEVEDHPLEYASFEGEIEEGYGKGKVEKWDEGRFWIEKWNADEILFAVKSKKLSGKYGLIKIEGDKNWLLIKRKEETA